jgi:Tol biopolymer transport system component
LWPGTSFGDPEHGLNAAVNRLRETLGDSATDPEYIETVPGRGYRFVASIESPLQPVLQQDGDKPKLISSEPEPKARSPKAQWWKGYASIAITTCVVLTGILYLSLSPRIGRLLRLYDLRHLTLVPVTTLPGHVYSASFSPDGGQVAFTWDHDSGTTYDVYLKALGSEEPLRITNNGDAGRPAWSPDGRKIAFWRFNLEKDFGIYLMPALGGPERKIAASARCPCSGGMWMSWSPDGKHLAFVERDEGLNTGTQLFLLSIDSMERSPVNTNCNYVTNPAFSPRGDYLAWACADNLVSVAILLKRLGDGSVTQLLEGVDGVEGMAWSNDGRRIVFSNSMGDLWEVALAQPNQPQRVLAGQNASEVTVNPTGNNLIFTQQRVDENIWRVDLSVLTAPTMKLAGSTRTETAPDISPDGKQIAFESTRSGSHEVWVSDFDGSNAVQLSSFGVSMTGSPRWSPDGKLIVFDSRIGGVANLYVVDPRGGIPRKLEIDIHSASSPVWSHDGQWIYFVSLHDSKKSNVWKVPSKGGRATRLIHRDAEMPRESPDGEYIYFSSNWRLWRVNRDGTGEEQIQGLSQVPIIDAWSVSGSGIYFLNPITVPPEIDFFDLSTQKIRRVHVMENVTSGWMGGLPIAPDGRWLLFSQIDAGSSNLMMVENWN